MNHALARGLARATALTRAGRLTEATAAIQTLLGGERPDPAPRPAADDVVEGQFTRIDMEPAEASAETGPQPEPRTRSRLSETLRRIAAGGMPAASRISTQEVSIPPGAKFLSLTHLSDHGSIGYRLYVPATPADAAMPLVIMLHGCTQSPEDFAIGTGMNAIAEELGWLIAYPAQPFTRNAQKCWNWFRPEDQLRDKGEPALIASIASDIVRGQRADPSRIYIAGLSAGGAAAVIAASRYPDIFSAVGVHSGLPAGSATDVPSAFSAMRSGGQVPPHHAVVPVIVFHGSADKTVHPRNARAVISQATDAMSGLSCETTAIKTVGDRAATRTVHRGRDGRPMAELWEIEGAGHAWMGGQEGGSYVDPTGPDASRHMIEFFLHHAKRVVAPKEKP